MSANTQPPKGMRDFLPREVRRRDAVVATIREVYEAHGFEPLETPACERLEVLLGKYGEEGDRLVFRILQRGEKVARALESGTATENDLCDMALRYDLTVPLARVVAEHGHALPRFFRRYQIQPVFRADRPGKGRFREFSQCDIDVVGSRSLLVEVEVASAAAEALRRLGLDDFRIRLNHRSLLKGLIEAAGVPRELEVSTLVAVDKLDKIGREGVSRELALRGVPGPAAERLEGLLHAGEGLEPEAVLDAVGEALSATESGRRGAAELRDLLRLSRGSAAEGWFRVDPSLARGLDYYTGAIFEVEAKGASGSIGSGGRYDGLVGMFLGSEVPACGFSLGLERVLALLEERGLGAEPRAASDVLVAPWDDALAPEAVSLARELRGAGLRVELHPEPGRIGRQMKYAAERGCAFVALVGPDEAAAGRVALKDLRSGEQVAVERAEAPAWLRGRLSAGA